jgi:hypothetical protein
MGSRSADKDEERQPPGRVATLILRAIDACLRALQKLRSRFEPPAEERGAAPGAGKRGGAASEESPAAAEAPPKRHGFLYRLLVVLACLLIGAGGGTWVAYRGMAKMLDVRAAAVDRLHDDLDIARKEQTRSVNEMTRFQKENAELRLQAIEARHETESDKARIDELEKQLAEVKHVERPAAPGRHATVEPGSPPKSGRCAVGTGNPSADLTNCIEKFNQP